MVPDPQPVWITLLAWYAAHGRNLPWRHTRDPYAILVSEIMLQQTQVDRVIPKYLAFLAAFPTLADLASAPTDAVIRHWSGLGYNQRAVRLQQVARTVVTDYGGQMPDSIAGLMRLPGIGRYTAGAIACFAFMQPVATVDTNIRRVLARIVYGEFTSEAAATAKPDVALRLAEAVTPPDPDRAYAWNQALMDLGATICVARTPACERCPVAAHCQTYAALAQHALFPTGAVLRQIAESQALYTSGNTINSKKTDSFKTSNRYFRGRVIAALRSAPAGGALALPDLGPQVKPGYGADDESWLRQVVAGLVRDGLAAWADDAQTGVRLPQ
jgi:A/G-specific adenine glycosylase